MAAKVLEKATAVEKSDLKPSVSAAPSDYTADKIQKLEGVDAILVTHHPDTSWLNADA